MRIGKSKWEHSWYEASSIAFDRMLVLNYLFLAMSRRFSAEMREKVFRTNFLALHVSQIYHNNFKLFIFGQLIGLTSLGMLLVGAHHPTTS